jgi:CTP:phosphocholine cytidylyltransferase-like protein
MGWNLAESSHTRQHNYQAILLHTIKDEMLDMDVASMDNQPLAMANINIVNKPLILYQLEYLQKHNIHDILITVEKKFASKIEKYLKTDFKS